MQPLWLAAPFYAERHFSVSDCARRRQVTAPPRALARKQRGGGQRIEMHPGVRAQVTQDGSRWGSNAWCTINVGVLPRKSLIRVLLNRSVLPTPVFTTGSGCSLVHPTHSLSKLLLITLCWALTPTSFSHAHGLLLGPSGLCICHLRDAFLS